jgi:hypothetical protein
MPDRIQLSRAAGWRMPPNTVKVDRSTLYGNPWAAGPTRGFNVPMEVHPWWLGIEQMIPAGPLTTATAVFTFRTWLQKDKIADDLLPVELTLDGQRRRDERLAVRRDLILSRLPSLRGKHLGCWCQPGSPCHADVLLELANR